MIGDFLETYNYEYLLNLALSFVSDDVDKREGSIIYDALAPVCYVLTQQVAIIQSVYQNTFIEYSEGSALDLRVAEQGVTRYQATYAVKKVYLTNSEDKPTTAPLGSRFSTISVGEPINYTLTDYYIANDTAQPGYYLATCETAGVRGNEYTGELIAISNLSNVSKAVMSDLITPARDEETDDELRSRFLERVNEKSFGGNIAQYREELKDISGVGAVQIYPIWNGGGTVKISVIDPNYNVITNDFITELKEQIDPENNSGEGLGIAPIGHKVTITTPTEVTVNVSATITLESGYTKTQVEEPIKTAISNYITNLKQNWGTSNSLNQYGLAVYIARINASILSVEGVANVTDTKINSSATDLTLTENATTQQLPKMGEVTLDV